MNPEDDANSPKSNKSREAFRTISEVADYLDLPQHVLRFWESKFAQIKPLKRGGNRRYYRPDDVVLLSAIKKLLHTEGYTIRGVQKLFKAQGVKATISLAVGEEDLIADTVNDADVGTNVESTDAAPSVRSVTQQVSTGKLLPIISRLKTLRANID